MVECTFCDLINGKDRGDYYNRILYENNSFIVVPALGAIVEGYLLVISKRHIGSMCYLNENEKTDYIQILNVMREVMKGIYNTYPIIFEHGTAHNEVHTSASSIDHAHAHIVAHTFYHEKNVIEKWGFKK